MTGSVGRRYARALFSLVKENQGLEAAAAELQQLASITDDPAVRAVLNNPTMTPSRRRHIAELIVEKLKPSETMTRFVKLLSDRQRLSELPSVAREFQRLLDRELGRARVTVRAPSEIPAQQQQDILSAFARITGKTIVPSFEVDPDLLGGVVVEAEGKVYDGSIKTQLERLAKQLSGAAQ